MGAVAAADFVSRALWPEALQKESSRQDILWKKREETVGNIRRVMRKERFDGII